MFTNKQSLIICGILVIGFFASGIFNLLDHLIVKLVLGCLVVLVILNLFLVKKDISEESDDISSNDLEI